MKTIVDKLIEDAGSQVALGKRVGVKQQSIGRWKRKGKVPPAQALKIKKSFNGKYSLHEICPAFYPRD